MGSFDFGNGKDGLFALKGTAAVAGTALDDAVFGTLLLLLAIGLVYAQTGHLNFAALGGADAFTAGARVVAVYNAPLNSACNHGIAKGNPNEVYLRYPRSPFADQSGDAGFTRTPSDDACAYTWDLALTKRGSDGDKPLARAVLSIADDRGRTLAADGTWDAEGKATVTTGEDGRVTVAREWSCGVNTARPDASRSRPFSKRTAPAFANRADNVSTVSSAWTASGSCRRMSPVSMPASRRMRVTPVTASPARMAAAMGAAPRQRGNSEAGTLSAPSGAKSSTARGRICRCSSWCAPTTPPLWSKSMQRVLVVPWSMAAT